MIDDPWTIYPIEIDLWQTSYVVAPGHKLRITVSSSNFPRFNSNYGNGYLLNDTKWPGLPMIQRNTLFQSSEYPSRVTLPVIEDKNKDIPKVDLMTAVKERYPEITEEMIDIVEEGMRRKNRKEMKD
jgi:hypothetical protein